MLTAVLMAVTALAAPPADEMSSEAMPAWWCRPRRCCHRPCCARTRAHVDREAPCAVPMPATVTSRLIFAHHTRELAVQRGAVAGEARRRRLRRQGRETIEQVADVVERAVLNLQGRQTIVGVADTLVQHRRVRTVAVRNREAGCVITGLADAEAARQARQCAVQTDVGGVQIGLGVRGRDVADDRKEAVPIPP